MTKQEFEEIYHDKAEVMAKKMELLSKDQSDYIESVKGVIAEFRESFIGEAKVMYDEQAKVILAYREYVNSFSPPFKDGDVPWLGFDEWESTVYEATK